LLVNFRRARTPTTSNGGGYGNWSGTSFASPITAGAVAMIMAANPALSADQVEQILKDSADKIAGDLHPYYGYGRINVANAVSMAMSSAKVIAPCHELETKPAA